MTDHAPQLQPLIVLQCPSHAHMDWTHGCSWGLWGSGQKASRGLTADPIQHLHVGAYTDLWSESAD